MRERRGVPAVHVASAQADSCVTGLNNAKGEAVLHGTAVIVRDTLKSVTHIGYHLLVIVLSAGIALSLPALARSFLSYWSKVEHEKAILVAIEAGVAVILILFFNSIRQSIQDRKLARMAAAAGLVSFFPAQEPQARNRIAQLKEKQGTGRTVMVIGSSGYGTLFDQVGDLASVLDRCVGARILLLNPYSQEAQMRIGAIAHPGYTMEHFRDEVRQSIELLKRLKAVGKSVRLKLYSDQPLVKLVVLGDYLWLQHYHSDVDVRSMPEYLLQHNLKDHGLYTLCHQYFLQRWGSREIPEYDLDSDELVYRSVQGSEVRRLPFDQSPALESAVGRNGALVRVPTVDQGRGGYESTLLPGMSA